MSVLYSPRAPWLMLAVFSAAALVFFVTAAGRDFGLIRWAAVPEEPVAVNREIRMPIILENYKLPKVEKEIPHAIDAGTPVPAEHRHGQSAEQSAESARQAVPAPRPTARKAADLPGMLLSHHFRLTEAGFEAVFKTDKPASGARIFFKSSPDLWWLDLPGIWKNTSPHVNPIDQGPIGRVIIGEHEDFLRVVFHYRDSGRVRPAQTPVVTEKENGFTVVIPISEP